MSDSNRVQISYIKEVTAGITPAGNITPLPITGESLKGAAASVESQIIRSDGNVPDLIRTEMVPQGGFNTELGFGLYDALLEAAFRNTLEAAVTKTASTIAYVEDVADTITDSGSGFVTAGFKVNDIINVTGFVNANNNGLYFVTSVAAGVLGVVALDASKTPIDAAASPSITIKTQRLRNGVADHSFSFEKAWLDKATMFHAYRGMMVDSLQGSISAKSVMTLAFGFIGKGHTVEVATIGSGYAAAPTADSMNTVGHFRGSLLRHNDAGVMAQSAACITKIDFNIANAVRRDTGLNCTIMGKGKFMFTVTWEVFFENMDIYNQYVADGFTTLAFGMLDSTGKGYGMVIPKIRYSDADIMAGGGDQPVVAKFSGQGVLQTVGSDKYTASMFILA